MKACLSWRGNALPLSGVKSTHRLRRRICDVGFQPSRSRRSRGTGRSFTPSYRPQYGSRSHYDRGATRHRHTLPDGRRVIAAEDTPELHLDRFWDGVGLLAEREASGASGMLDWRQLYDHLMRATPDHILFGEISTQNAFAALAALMTPDECMSMPGIRLIWKGRTVPGDMLIFVAGNRPIYGRQWLYFQDKKMKAHAALPAPGVKRPEAVREKAAEDTYEIALNRSQT